ncbi:hypothetical protein GYMLUDRAFT_1021879 [Collybiopsis luxurians FD-317 M1]|uniref:Gfo/Idh/MocA-like oxidoreductase N-terminal domain-containing protein n=1 Tax=Collybiopsis luxurians FD-317 M1 TaxID=944289 RepID=A0A0D0CII7_9AGAR|nr:hypothetical protein GYMLUDRAFT_1021879 [Collybiopsis luxurians FD-317 M1]
MVTLESTPIRLGFIGLSTSGWASMGLAPPLFEKPLSSRYSVVAVSTTRPESAEASAAKYSELASKATGTKVTVKPYHGSAEHIAADKDIDMVVAAVKVLNHKEVATKVIDAGKDLFIEWPAGRKLAETKELYEAAKKAGVKTVVGFQMRFANFALKAKSAIDSGKLGKIVSSTFMVSSSPFWGHTTPEFGKYILEPSNGATLLDIVGGHALDLFTHILGPILSVSAVAKNQIQSSAIVDMNGKPTGEILPQNGATQICVSGLLASGAVFNVHFQSGVKESDFQWIIQGENCSLRLIDPDPTPEKRAFFDATPEVYLDGQKVDLLTQDADPSKLLWEAIADGKEEYFANLEQALKVKEVLDAITKSANEGRRVDL